jgi:hypothetical protein
MRRGNGLLSGGYRLRTAAGALNQNDEGQEAQNRDLVAFLEKEWTGGR